MKLKSKKKIIILIVVAVILIGAIIFAIFKSISNSRNMFNMQSSSATVTKTVEITPSIQTIQNTLTSSGQITSGSTEKLELNTSRYFKTMCVESDDTVLAGENILQYTNGTYLTAEYDCVVISYSVPETSSICTSSNYIEVQSLETLNMSLTVDESDINSVAVGQEVEIELTAFEDKTYTGAISKIDSVGNYSSSGSSFTATVEFENDGDVKIGMSASCTIIIEEAKDCLAVPIEAVQTSGDTKYVIVVKEDGTTENVTIETGISNDSYVEIKSGLTVEETIQTVQTTTSNNRGNGNFNKSQMSGDMPEGMGSFQMQDNMGEMPQMPSRQ